MRKTQKLALVRGGSPEKHMVVSTEYGTSFSVSVYTEKDYTEIGETATPVEWYRVNNKEELDATYVYLCTKYGVVISSTVCMTDCDN